jgi:hypothetical protein
MGDEFWGSSTHLRGGKNYSYPHMPNLYRYHQSHPKVEETIQWKARWCTVEATERMSRSRLEYLITATDSHGALWAAPRLREAFEKHFAHHGTTPWDPPAFTPFGPDPGDRW